MDNFLRITDADGAQYDLPVDVAGGGREFVAEHPMLASELNITSVCLVSEHLEGRINFVLEHFTLVEEAGRWTVTVREGYLGIPEYHLEYYATESFGRKVKHPTVYQWDHEKEEMAGN